MTCEAYLLHVLNKYQFLILIGYAVKFMNIKHDDIKNY